MPCLGTITRGDIGRRELQRIRPACRCCGRNAKDRTIPLPIEVTAAHVGLRVYGSDLDAQVRIEAGEQYQARVLRMRQGDNHG